MYLKHLNNLCFKKFKSIILWLVPVFETEDNGSQLAKMKKSISDMSLP